MYFFLVIRIILDNKDDIVSSIILNNPCKYVSHFYVVVMRYDVKC